MTTPPSIKKKKERKRKKEINKKEVRDVPELVECITYQEQSPELD